jgi:hypothetical protein
MTKLEFKELFKTYPKRLAECCSIERYNHVFPISHFMLDGRFNELSKEIQDTITNNRSNEILEPLRNFSNTIYREFTKSLNSSEKFGKNSARQYKKIYDFLLVELHHLNTNAIQVPVAKNTTEFKKPQLSEYNKPIINKKKVLALMHLFREFKLVNKDLTYTALADCFGTLSGYAGSQLRKDLSEFNKHEILFKQDEIDTLKSILIKMNEELSNLPLK